MSTRRKMIKLGTDFISMAIVGIPVLYWYIAGKPYIRGFNCDDESIRYPFKESTVTNVHLYIFGLGIPVVTICAVESIRFVESRGSIRNGKQWDFAWQLYNKLVIFAFGALSSQFLTDIAKYTIGRLRPHFIAICRPDVLRDGIECPEGKGQYLYIDEYTCLNEVDDPKKVKDSRLSFMSGHSSFSAYCMLYVAIYLQARAKWQHFGLSLLRPLVQLLVIYLSLYTGLSRISDYKHHWSDVLIGLIQGSLVAVLTARFASDLFRKVAPESSVISPKVTIYSSSNNQRYNSTDDIELDA